MDYQFVFKNMEPSDALRSYTEHKLAERLSRFTRLPISVEIFFSYDNHLSVVHCNYLAADGETLVIEVCEEDMYKSVDKMVDNLDRKISRHLERLKDHRNANKRLGLYQPFATELTMGPGATDVPEGERDEVDAEDLVKFERQRQQFYGDDNEPHARIAP